MAQDLPAVCHGENGRKPAKTRRDALGRFVAGASPGPGRPANPFARYQVELRAALLAEVSPADLRTVLRQVIKIAKRGHLPAVELLLKWVLGAPPAPVDPDRLDEHEWSVKRGRPTVIDQLALGEAPDAEDRDEAPAEPAEDPRAPVGPPLQEVLSWAVEELAATQAALRAQRPPPSNSAAGWEQFAASRLEFDAQAAVDLETLLVAYLRWCASHGEPPLEEAQVLAWLRDHDATMRTGTLTQTTMVIGVRVTA